MILCCPGCKRPMPPLLDGLTPIQRQILDMIRRHGYASSASIYCMLYTGKPRDRVPKVIDVHINQMNKALRERGLVIRRRRPRHANQPWVLAEIAEPAE